MHNLFECLRHPFIQKFLQKYLEQERGRNFRVIFFGLNDPRNITVHFLFLQKSVEKGILIQLLDVGKVYFPIFKRIHYNVFEPWISDEIVIVVYLRNVAIHDVADEVYRRLVELKPVLNDLLHALDLFLHKKLAPLFDGDQSLAIFRKLLVFVPNFLFYFGLRTFLFDCDFLRRLFLLTVKVPNYLQQLFLFLHFELEDDLDSIGILFHLFKHLNDILTIFGKIKFLQFFWRLCDVGGTVKKLRHFLSLFIGVFLNKRDDGANRLKMNRFLEQSVELFQLILYLFVLFIHLLYLLGLDFDRLLSFLSQNTCTALIKMASTSSLVSWAVFFCHDFFVTLIFLKDLSKYLSVLVIVCSKSKFLEVRPF